MIRLNELTGSLQAAARTHGNMECEICISDSRKHRMYGSAPPTFEVIPDKERGDWLGIRFEGTPRDT